MYKILQKICSGILCLLITFTYVYLFSVNCTAEKSSEKGMFVLDSKECMNLQNAEIVPNRSNLKQSCIYMKEGSNALWNINGITGKYQIQIQYFCDTNNYVDVKCDVKINGHIQALNHSNLSLQGCYVDKTQKAGKFDEDINGNQMRPSQTQKEYSLKQILFDSTGYDNSPIELNFEEQNNTLELSIKEGSIYIEKIILTPYKQLKPYSEIKSQYEREGYKFANNKTILFEAEKTLYKSKSTLFPSIDTANASTSPNSPMYQKVNMIGGTNWSKAGQSITWELDVPEDGLYQLSFKYRKNTDKGKISYRRLYIDDEIPFEEANEIAFNYSKDWKNFIVGDKEPYYFYLTKGKHKLALEVSLGPQGEYFKQIKESLLNLNEIYREILVITGATPDLYRDYRLEELLPETFEKIKKEKIILEEVVTKLSVLSGQKGSSFSTIETMIRVLDDMYQDPRSLPKKFTYFKSNIGSLGTWLNNAGESPIELDYIMLSSKNSGLPNAKKNWFSRFLYSIKSILYSYIIDYDSIGDISIEEKDAEDVTVWIMSGRDQFQILKSLVNSGDLQKKGVHASVKLVNGGVLLQSIVADRGPDVALGVSSTDVINYALRGATLELSQFEDYSEIKNRFASEALVPLTLESKVYALPQTQSFPVLFYRKDILSELNLNVPETWDDVNNMLSELNKNKLEFALPATIQTYFSLLTQSGGKMFNDLNNACAFDDKTGITAFKHWTDYYINYGFDLSYDFQNRFRTGEMPIGIEDYSLYNTLKVAAPEIEGLWDITLIPGTRREDGSIDRTACLSISGCIALNSTKSPKAAWEFLKWWTSSDIQREFGLQIEGVLGASSRYPTANNEALKSLPWSSEQKVTLLKQLECSKAVPEIPGGYLVSRDLINAFRQVVLQGKDFRDTLLEYTNIINAELKSKREEFNLS